MKYFITKKIKLKYLKKPFSLFLGIIILFTGLISVGIFAAEYDLQKPPEKLAAAENGIGKNQYEGNYVDLMWEYPSSFILPDTTGTYLNFYTHEIPKPYQSSVIKTELKEGNIRVSTTPTLSPTLNRLKELKSGTMYYIDIAAFYRYQYGDDIRQGEESQHSNRIKVLTDIEVEAYSLGTNQIKIEWDDVWNTNGRIGYNVFVSDSDKFANTPSKYIDSSNIGAGKAVEVNQSTGKLTYIHSVSEPGRVYYVKIEPEIVDADYIYYNESCEIAPVSSFILARTSKVSSSSDGSIWRIDWSQVYAGWSDRVDIKYEVYKGDARNNDLPSRIQTVNNTSIFDVLKPEEESYTYYLIKAIVTRKDNGELFYPGIKIESDKIYVKDYDVAAYPPMPEIRDKIGNLESEINPSSATVLWKAPQKPTGEIDFDTQYDIWLATDPDALYDSAKLANSITWDFKSGNINLTQNNINFKLEQVKSITNNLLGFSCKMTDLNQNTAYYFKIEAKKGYLENIDEVPVQISYSSVPAIEVIVTPTDGETGTPVTPPKPPFYLKKNSEGTQMVTDTSAVIQIKNRWYEKYNEETNRWEYIKTEKDELFDPDPTYPIKPEEIINHQHEYRLLKYDSKVKLDVYYLEYEEGMDYLNLYDESKYKPSIITGISAASNDDIENPELNYPDKSIKRNVDISISGLKANTTYIIWVKATRDGANPNNSEPSDPIIVTTYPIDASPIETPTVPALFVNQAGDDFVDLIWEVNEEYNYYLDYGTSENMGSTAKGTMVDMNENNYYRVEELEKDTIYYFRIRAEFVGESGESIMSDWSNPVPAKTLADIPPLPPKGFGIKSGKNAVTKNSINFEWLQEGELEYLLEISDNSFFREAELYECGSVSEYSVDGLISNKRYYSRLYAYDSSKKLFSEPTAIISVLTKRSRDDYDSDEDSEKIIEGDFFDKKPIVIDGVWIISITGINADRLIEHIKKDKVLDYKLLLIDVPEKADKIKVTISAKVFKALAKLKENLIFEIPDRQFTIKHGMLDLERAVKELDVNKDFSLEFLIELDKVSSPGITYTTISAHDDLNSIKIEELKTPLKMTDASIYDDISRHWARKSIIYVASLRKIKSINGRKFQPDKFITIDDAVKFILDIMEYEYGNNHLSVALRSGIISTAQEEASNKLCRREELIAMTVKVYELLSGEKAISSKVDITNFNDLGETSTLLLPQIRFAYENGIIISRFDKLLGPADPITRADVMVLFEKLFLLSGLGD